MRLDKKQGDVLNDAMDSSEVSTLREAIGDDSVFGWSVFDSDGGEVASNGLSETVTAVCSNVLDLAMQVGADLGEEAETPSLTFVKGTREMQMTPLETVNMLVVRDKSAGFRKEQRNGG